MLSISRRHLVIPMIITALAAAAPALATDAPVPWLPGKVKPSDNAGKRGVYQVSATNPTYKYHVYVPRSYSEKSPAGLHIFFHGQGKPSTTPSFGRWSRHFLEPHTLIGINMLYLDGDNTKDTAGKVRAAEEAIAQVAADYKVVIGRGSIASFSGGGLPHAKIHTLRARSRSPNRGMWPFNHTALYGSNFWATTIGAVPMSWFVGLGGKEWTMGKPTLGTTQTSRARELIISAAKKGTCADALLRIEKDKGHSISDADVAASAAQFARSDIAFAPFVYEGDFEGGPLAPVARAANLRQLGAAAKAADRLLARKTLDEKTKRQAEALRALIAARVDAVLKMLTKLAAKDPVLAESYARALGVQLMGHPRAKELGPILAGARRSVAYQNAMRAWPVFARKFAGFFGTAQLKKEAVPILEQIEKMSPPQSLMGTMSREFLLLRLPQEVRARASR